MLREDMVFELTHIKDTDVTRKLIVDLFSRHIEGGVTTPPRFGVEEWFTIKKGTLANVDKDTLTTVGRYFFNMYLVAPFFGELIPYINKTLNDDGLVAWQQSIIDLMMEQKIKPEQMGKMHNRIEWLKKFTGLFVPGLQAQMLYMSTGQEAFKKKLIAENADIIAKNDYVQYVEKVEKPLLEFSRQELKKLPGYRIFELGGKPKFGNNYKNCVLDVGPIFNPSTGTFEISTTAFGEGIKPAEFHLFANTLVKASYDRAVSTQIGGEMTKQLFSALQTVKFIPDTDCGSTKYRTVTVQPKTFRRLLYRYMIDPRGSLVLLTADVIKKLYGQTIQIRTPMYCKNEDYCNVCMGDQFRRMGIFNVGLATTRVTSTILNLSLKSMHDTSVKTVAIKFDSYVKFFEGGDFSDLGGKPA